MHLDPVQCLPDDGCAGTLIGRVWRPGVGPSVAALRDGGVFDITRAAPTVAGLLNEADPVAHRHGRRATAHRRCRRNPRQQRRRSPRPGAALVLLAPIDLQASRRPASPSSAACWSG